MDTSDKNNANGGGFGSRLMSGLKELILEDDVPTEGKATTAPKNNRGAVADDPALISRQTASIKSPMTASLLEQVLSRPSAFTVLNDALKPLEEIIPDEMTRYRAAFAVIKKNRSLEQVVQAIDLQHLQMLSDEVARFEAQAKQMESGEINVRVAEAATLKDNMDLASVQIIKLREEAENRIRVVQEGVLRDRTRMDEIDRELLEKRRTIAVVESQFSNAADSVKDTLQQAKVKILKYLSN